MAPKNLAPEELIERLGNGHAPRNDLRQTGAEENRTAL